MITIEIQHLISIIANRTTELDLFPDTKILVSKQQRDLRDFSQRNSDFTRSVSIPNTALNKRTLRKFIQNGLKEIPGDIIINGSSLGFDLKFTIDGFDEQQMTLNILFDNQLFFNKIRGDIKELDFSDLSFEWTPAGVDAIKDTTDIVYALALWMDLETYIRLRDQGANTWLTDQCIYSTGFFMYVKELFDRIVIAAGLTLDITNITTNDLFNNCAIPCPVANYIQPELTTTLTEENKSSADVIYNTSGDRLIFATVVTAGSSNWDNATNTEYDFGANTSLLVSALIDGAILDDSDEGGFIPPVIRLRRNTTTMREYIATFPITIVENIYVESGDELYIDVFWDDGDNEGISIDVDSNFNITSTIAELTIQINKHLPDVSRADFIRGVLNHTNLIVSNEFGVITLYDFDKVFEGYHEAEILDDRGIDEQFTFSNLFRNSSINYAKPAEPLTRSDTDRFFQVNDETLKDEGSIMELPFEACDVVNATVNGSAGLALIDAFDYEIDSYSVAAGAIGASSLTLSQSAQFGPLNYVLIVSTVYIRQIVTRTSAILGVIAGTWPATFSNLRYLIIRPKIKRKPLKIVFIEDADGDFDVFDTTNVSPTTITSGKKATFGENMLLGGLSEYDQLLGALQYPKIIQVWIKVDTDVFLTVGSNDIKFKVIYIKKLNERYWVNKIDQWDPETGVGRAELIRLR